MPGRHDLVALGRRSRRSRSAPSRARRRAGRRPGPSPAFETSWPMTVEVPSVSSTTIALSGPTSVTRPASAPPSTTTTSPSSIPSFEPLSSPMTRRNSDDSREMTAAATVSWSKPGLELEQRGEHARSRAGPRPTAPAALARRSFSCAQGRVVDPQPVDLGDGVRDRRDAAGDLVERALDRPEGEARRRSGARARSGSTENAMSTRLTASEHREGDASAAGGPGGEEGGHRSLMVGGVGGHDAARRQRGGRA